jgi:aminoacrylate hydrolase
VSRATVIADDGYPLAAECAGEGPPLLMISGLGGVAAFWDALRAELGSHFQVLVFDHRGTGGSGRPPEGPYTIQRMAADARAVLDHFHVARSHVLGHSTGGAIAQVLALDSAERVERLVLSGTWDRPDARFRRLFASRLALLLGGDLAAYQALTHVLGYPAGWIEAHDAELSAAEARAEAALAPLSVAAARIRMLLDHDRGADLAGIRAPTLVLAAGDDEIIPVHHAHRLAAAIPDAVLEIVTGGHFFPRTEPRATAAAVLRFLGSASP